MRRSSFSRWRCSPPGPADLADDPDAVRWRPAAAVPASGYNVQIAVEANHHLIVMHEVTTTEPAIAALRCGERDEDGARRGEARCVADRGYFNSEEIWQRGGWHTVTLPKPMTSNAKAEGRFGKQDFRYVADEDVYVCPAGEKLAFPLQPRTKAWSASLPDAACHSCAIKNSCTKGKE